ncbi:MAG: hypothetical protein JSV50_15300 [Desulfobacteraceae bacterium]|nr:MAG: hypothetical protein JSV50_15300 [Desulfobacteraceae bacterium]
MASFDRTIPPGEGGKITLTVNTKGYEGKIRKTTVVDSNDPKMPRFTLGIRAFVHVPISMRPRYVRLYGREEVSITRSIEIKAGLDKPLILEPDQFNLEGKLTYKIEEIDKGRKFKVYFTNIPGVAGSYRGFLNLKTNYNEKPVLNIRISGRFVKTKTDKQ